MTKYDAFWLSLLSLYLSLSLSLSACFYLFAVRVWLFLRANSPAPQVTLSWSHPLFDAANSTRESPSVNTNAEEKTPTRLAPVDSFVSCALLLPPNHHSLFFVFGATPPRPTVCASSVVQKQLKVLFEVQWRQRLESGVPKWETSAHLLRSNICRKKNLKLSTCYEFRASTPKAHKRIHPIPLQERRSAFPCRSLFLSLSFSLYVCVCVRARVCGFIFCLADAGAPHVSSKRCALAPSTAIGRRLAPPLSRSPTQVPAGPPLRPQRRLARGLAHGLAVRATRSPLLF
jgi:hypothetical protein